MQAFDYINIYYMAMLVWQVFYLVNFNAHQADMGNKKPRNAGFFIA